METSELPETMRAAQGTDYGPIDAVISVNDDVKVPRLSDLPPDTRKDRMLVKILSVSLAPGDCRVLSGKTRKYQGPPSFPYVPGGDCCGIVVELPENAQELDLPFAVGDRVAVRFHIEGPRGALGEYAIVSVLVADKVPDTITSDGAAALASATPATFLADSIQRGDRVLVLGAGGGVGSHLCQLLKTTRDASYVVGVSKDPQRLLDPPISCDKAIDYTQQDVFGMEEYQREPFDVVIDLASGAWPRILECVQHATPLIVKSASKGGRYITMSPDQPTYQLDSQWEMLKVFLFPALWRAVVSRTWSRSQLPAYTFAFALPMERDIMTRTLELAAKGKLEPVQDRKGPFLLTTEGVRSAFHLQESRHPQGKVVVHVANDK